MFFCGFCKTFKDTFFHGTPPVAASKSFAQPVEKYL